MTHGVRDHNTVVYGRSDRSSCCFVLVMFVCHLQVLVLSSWTWKRGQRMDWWVDSGFRVIHIINNAELDKILTWFLLRCQYFTLSGTNTVETLLMWSFKKPKWLMLAFFGHGKPRICSEFNADTKICKEHVILWLFTRVSVSERTGNVQWKLMYVKAVIPFGVKNDFRW